MTYSFNLMN